MVPNTAIPGNYSYNAYIRDHNTWELLAQDSFPFTKLPGLDSPQHYLGWALLGWYDDNIADNLHPLGFILHPCFPNPFNFSTVISFQLPAASEVELKIFDIFGREAAALGTGHWALGEHQVVWDAEGMPSGIYFVRLSVVGSRSSVFGSRTAVQKLLLLK
jgi:hypothetical protein